MADEEKWAKEDEVLFEALIASLEAAHDVENKNIDAQRHGQQRPFPEEIVTQPPIEKEGNHFYLWEAGEKGASEGRDFEWLDVARFAVNFIPSLGRNAGEVISALASPLETLDGMIQLGGGALEKALDLVGVDKKERYRFLSPASDVTEISQKGDRQRALLESAFSFYANRYGKDVRRTLTEDPAGALLDFASFLGGAGLGLRGTGAVSNLKNISRFGRATQEAGRAVGAMGIAPFRIGPWAARKALGLEKGPSIASSLEKRISQSLSTKVPAMQPIYEATKNLTKEGKVYRHPEAKRIHGIQTKAEIFDPVEETAEVARRAKTILNELENEYITRWDNLKDFTVDGKGLRLDALKHLKDEWKVYPVFKKPKKGERLPSVKAPPGKRVPDVPSPVRRLKRGGWWIRPEPKKPLKPSKPIDVFARDRNHNIIFETSSRSLQNTPSMRYIEDAANIIMNHTDYSKSGIRHLNTNIRRLFNKIPADETAKEARLAINQLRDIFRDKLREASPEALEVNQIWAKKIRLQETLKNARRVGMDLESVKARQTWAEYVEQAAISTKSSLNERRLVIGELEREMNMLLSSPYAAHKLTKIMPSVGLRETLYTVMSLSGFVNPWLFTGLIPLSLSSPRMQGNIARWLGASTRVAKRFENWHSAFADVIPEDLMGRGLTYGHLMAMMLERGIRFPDPPAVPFKNTEENKEFYSKAYGIKKLKGESRKPPATAKVLGF